MKETQTALKTGIRREETPSLFFPTGKAASISQNERQKEIFLNLPADHKPFTDKYFLRTTEILKKDKLNPWIRAQVFIRKGPGEVFGIDEALAIINKYSKLKEVGGKVWIKKEGSTFQSAEPLMFIEGPVQEIIELETMILGVISRETSKYNDGKQSVDTEEVKAKMAAVVKAAEGRPVMYAGARHWGYEQDAAIALAAKEGGASGASTDIGAKAFSDIGQGTIPHALEVIYAYKYGRENAVKEATLAFDRHIPENVKRIALVDFKNKEIGDALATARAFREKGRELYAVRIDTCGENLSEGAVSSASDERAKILRDEGIPLPQENAPDAKYWYGKGVTITAALALRRALDKEGFSDVKIILSSGFGKPAKVEAFVRAEKILGIKLFDGLLAGEVWNGGRIATMDLVAVGESRDDLKLLSKTGRGYRPNPNLVEVSLDNF